MNVLIDIIFCIRTAEQGYYLHTIASGIFILVPWIINMMTLIKSMTKWSNDPTIKDRVNGWLIDYSLSLIILTGICGSSFTGITCSFLLG